MSTYTLTVNFKASRKAGLPLAVAQALAAKAVQQRGVTSVSIRKEKKS